MLDRSHLLRERPHGGVRNQVTIEVGGRRRANGEIDVLQVRAEEVVELVVATGVLINAEPPEPVTPFGYVESLECGAVAVRIG